jgi:prevent-host-death family protein
MYKPYRSTMKRLRVTEARKELADTVNEVAYGGKRVVLRRHGRDVAAIVPMADVKLIEECEQGGPGRRGGSPRKDRANVEQSELPVQRRKAG